MKNITTKADLRHMAEEAAYSAKGHFKSADWLEMSVRIYIFVPLIISLLMMVFDIPEYAIRPLSFMSFLFSIIALYSVYANNQDWAKDVISKRMDLGNDYLEIYKELRSLNFSDETVSEESIKLLREKLSAADKRTSSLGINFVGKYWTKFVIKKEMDIDWIYK